MRSLLIVNARPFAQSRLALRAISNNYEHVGKYTNKGKPGRKMVSHFFQDRPPPWAVRIRVTALGDTISNQTLANTDTDHNR